MVNGRWTMVNGRWTMDNGQWTMGDGQWAMDNGLWTMVNGQWTMDDGLWTRIAAKHCSINAPNNIVKAAPILEYEQWPLVRKPFIHLGLPLFNTKVTWHPHRYVNYTILLLPSFPSFAKVSSYLLYSAHRASTHYGQSA